MPSCGATTFGGSKQSKKGSRKGSRTRKSKGGSVLEAAIVPFGLFAIQKWFGTRSTRKSSSGKKRGGQQQQQQQQQQQRKRSRGSRK